MNPKTKPRLFIFFTLCVITVLLANVACKKSWDPCASKPSDAGFMLGDTLVLPYRVTFENPKARMTIRFDSLLEDSRCPEGLMCFWEGNARVSFLFEEPGGRHRFALNTYSGFTRDTLISGYRVSLLDVLPRRKAGIPVDPRDYRAVVKIE